MTLSDLKAKIETLPVQKRADARHNCDERIGILCGAAEPTPGQLAIVYEQLFPPAPPATPDLFG